ncbi:ankyrin repeat domain-containing protein [Wolbachia endosymbiont (group B) of Pammene fasciana]|uniref:ankyrin repeat domain-containing protein n=1 Tax=Wolbachia endosymbiont (group B) of Pammene fasciana TaxID=2954037 RepID=UPI002232AE7E|nr:ankyrin repeat domain-containing protein [Wolbachia endosymbiont (group B) of Pammene fasciana]
MTDLLKIINDGEKKFTEKIKELQEYLNDNSEIVINKRLFALAILNKIPVNGDLINKEGGKIVYPILHHCIEHDSVISEKKEKLSFQDVMKILDETVNRFITPQYFYKLINFQDQSSKNTLLHQAVISNNTEAIEALLKYGANPLIKNEEGNISLDLAHGNTKKVLIECMKDQAKSKKESARCNSLIGIIPGVFLGIGLGVGSALVPSMTIILCTLAVSALVAGIAVGVAIYFLSQDYKQAKSIEEAVNPQLSSVKYEKTVDNKAVLG